MYVLLLLTARPYLLKESFGELGQSKSEKVGNYRQSVRGRHLFHYNVICTFGRFQMPSLSTR